MPFERKLDWAKLKAAIKSAESTGKDHWTTLKQMNELKCGQLTGPYGARWVYDITVLYCIASHARGKLHMTKRWFPRGDSLGSREMVPITMEMQSSLIGDAWKEFAQPEQPAGETDADTRIDKLVAKQTKEVVRRLFVKVPEAAEGEKLVVARLTETQMERVRQFKAWFVEVPETEEEKNFPDPDYGL
jgi:hypothetical protein